MKENRWMTQSVISWRLIPIFNLAAKQALAFGDYLELG
jgi:hypothetical protein